MKKLILLLPFLAILAFATISCNKNQDNIVLEETIGGSEFELATTNSGASIPANVHTALKTNFPTATNAVWSELVENDAYSTDFDLNNQTGHNAEFLGNGVMLAHYRSIPVDSLPLVAKNYLATNYTGYTWVKGYRQKDSAGVIVAYKTIIRHNNQTIVVRFNGAGAFVSATILGGGQGGGTRHCRDTIATVNTLPAAVTTYLTANYPGYMFLSGVIKRSTQTNVCTVKGYEIKIKSATNIFWGIKFDAAGGFLNAQQYGGPAPAPCRDTILAAANIPAAIATWLNTNYPAYTFLSGEIERENQANVCTIEGYEIKIKSATNIFWEIEFNAAGGFVNASQYGGPAPAPCRDTILTAANIPPAIATWLTANISGNTFVSGTISRDNQNGACSIRGYNVTVLSNGVRISVSFNALGVFGSSRRVGSATGVVAMRLNQIPAAITTYLSTNYAGNRSNGVTSYKQGTTLLQNVASIRHNNMNYDVYFDAANVFVRALKTN